MHLKGMLTPKTTALGPPHQPFPSRGLCVWQEEKSSADSAHLSTLAARVPTCFGPASLGWRRRGPCCCLCCSFRERTSGATPEREMEVPRCCACLCWRGITCYPPSEGGEGARQWCGGGALGVKPWWAPKQGVPWASDYLNLALLQK